jgi:hypothetical protein
MQKIVLCGTEKITLLEQIVGDYEDCLDNLKRKNEEIEAKLKDMDLKMQDFNIADLLKENAKMGDNGEDAQGNNLLLNVVSNLEKKMNAKTKMTDERLNKIEETNFKLVKETQNMKNAQDGNKRTLKNLKQANDDIISNMKNLEKFVLESAHDTTQKFESQIKSIPKEKEEKDESSKSEKKERKNSLLSISQPEPQIDLENNEKIKEIVKRLADLEKDVKKLPNQLGVEQIKSDVSALKSGIGNCALSQDLKEAREKDDDMQKQINFLKDQFDDYTSNTADHEDLQNVKRKLELLNSKEHENETNIQEIIKQMSQNSNNNMQFTGSDKYLEVHKYEDFKTQIIKEFSSVNDNFTHLRRLVDNILDALKNKPSYRDIKALEEEITVKFEEIKVASAKKFAEKIETTKNFKYLDQQIKHILQVYIRKDNKSDNWLLAKKSLNANLCASCESYIGDLKDNSNFQPWNKYPLRDPNDKVYRLGNGFSKMLQLIQVDENDKKNAGMVTYQNNNELNIGNKLMRLEKVDMNANNVNNIGPIKTEVNTGTNERKVLPKIKGNSTLNNFMKNSNSNRGYANRTSPGNNVTQDNEGEGEDDNNDGLDEKEEDKPKITKIVKVNKD